MPAVATHLLHGDPWGIGRPIRNMHPALAQLVHEAMPIIGRLCRDGRLTHRDEIIPFRFLGARGAHAGIDSEVAGVTVRTAAAEAVMDATIRRTHELDDL